jgi:hypothetical protein
MTWFDRGNKPPSASKIPAFQRKSAQVEGVNWQPVERREPLMNQLSRRRTSRRPPSLRPSRMPPAQQSVAPEALVSRPPGPRISVAPSARSRPPTEDVSLMRVRYEEAIANLEQAVADLVDMKEQNLSHEQDRLAELAIAIAKRVVSRELRTDPTLVAGLAVEGIVALGERDGATVRVGPLLAEADTEALMSALRAKLPKSEIVRDESLEPGDCIVETTLGSVDESLGVRLDAAVRAISGEGEDDS